MIEPYSLSEIRHRARERFGPTASVFHVKLRLDGVWWAVGVSGRIIGFRRELAELPDLIRRGPLIPLFSKATS